MTDEHAVIEAPPDIVAASEMAESSPARPEDRGTGRAAGNRPSWRAFSRFGPLLTLIAPLVFNAVELRSEASYVPYTNDSSVHAEMVRYAVAQFRAGHFPLDGWFPYLNLGSPFFMHYQSLGAMLAGILGLAIGANRSFSLCLYVLLVTWPVSVYLGARLFRFSRWTAAFAAVASAFVASSTSVGFEQGAYIWVGYGLWTQLWAMWTLPLAWGFSWRAVNDGRNYLWACLFIALTAAFHFEIGYWAFIPILLWIVVQPSRVLERAKRGLIVAVGTLSLAAWVIVPLLVYKGWTSVNEFLQHGPDVNSYGAGQVLSWLFHGDLFDDGRFPLISLFIGAGAIACASRWRRDLKSRALLGTFVVSLVLYFGRTTFGSAINLLPGSKELFLRRFIAAVHLSGILLAGVGAVAVGSVLSSIGQRVASEYFKRSLASSSKRAVALVVFAAVIIAGTSPMWINFNRLDRGNASYVRAQRSVAGLESDLNRLVAIIKRKGGGRTYAGMLFSGWGPGFRVGDVRVVQYLANDQVDEIGFTNRSASLMSDPEAEFVDSNPADYAMFGVRFVILPDNRRPPSGAKLLKRSGPYYLWFLSKNGYVQVVDTTGPPLAENRAHMGSDSAKFLESSLAGSARYPVVSFGGRAAALPTLASGARPPGAPGYVISQDANLQEGEYTTMVHANRTAVVLLKVSYDPGWTVDVDGKSAKTEMIAPAFVGVRVGPGTHTVKFRYQSFRYYPELFALPVAGLLLLGFGTRRPRRLRSLPHAQNDDGESKSRSKSL